MKAVLRPLFLSKGFDRVLVSHQINHEGAIDQEVITHVLSADIVVANLTGLNANVMYELAVRHCTYKPTICIAKDGTKLPFDILLDRVLFFRNDFLGIILLKKQLKERVENIASGKTGNNPVLRARQSLPNSALLANVDPPHADSTLDIESLRETLRDLSSPRYEFSVESSNHPREYESCAWQEYLSFSSPSVEMTRKFIAMVDSQPFVLSVSQDDDNVDVFVETESSRETQRGRRWVLSAAKQCGLRLINST